MVDVVVLGAVCWVILAVTGLGDRLGGLVRHAEGTASLQRFLGFLCALICVVVVCRVGYSPVAAQRGGLPSLGWPPAGVVVV